MKIDIVTIFPKMFEGPFEESMVKRAVDKGVVEVAEEGESGGAEHGHRFPTIEKGQGLRTKKGLGSRRQRLFR